MLESLKHKKHPLRKGHFKYKAHDNNNQSFYQICSNDNVHHHNENNDANLVIGTFSFSIREKIIRPPCERQ